MAEENIQQQNSEESKNDKIWWYLLLGLLQDSTESKWQEYTKQLMYANRFSSSHEVIDLVCSIGDIVTRTITKGTQLYRARIFHREPLDNFIGNLFESASTDNKSNFSKNIVLFDNQFCEALSSDYIEVQGINLTFSNPGMYELGQIVTSIDK